MKAFIFAAGLGTRLRPFTYSHPKALVDVGGEPMLRHVIDKVVDAGATEVVINVHHFSEQIERYIHDIHLDIDAKLIISDESDELRDTGGGLLFASRYLDGSEPFIVYNADILSEVDLQDMMDFHRSHNADVSLYVAERDSSRQLVFSPEGRLEGWVNMLTGKTLSPGNKLESQDLSDTNMLCFNGVHIISPGVFKYLKRYASESAFPIMPFYATTCDRLRILAYQRDDIKWFDVGKPESLKLARTYWENTYH